MAKLHILSLIILALFPLFLQSTLSINPPTASPTPSPSPSLAAVDSPPSPLPPSNRAPSPSPSFTNLRDSPSPAPSQSHLLITPPQQAPAADEVKYSDRSDDKSDSSSSSGGRTVGIVIGVVAAACVVVVGGKVYRKRRDNIRRSRYRNSSREDFL